MGKLLVNSFHPMPLDVRHADAIGGEDSCIRVGKNLRNAEFFRNGARVLPCRAAKGDQHVVTRIATLGDGDCAYRLGHVGVSNPQESAGQFQGRVTCTRCRKHFCNDLVGPLYYRISVERKGEMLWLNLSQQQIHICDRQRPTASVACRPRVGASALGPNA